MTRPDGPAPPPRYDQVAAQYDATRGWPPAVAAAIGRGLHTLLAAYARPGRPPRVLEVGAGTGRVLAPLAAAGAWAVGLDVSPGMLRLLQAKAAGLADGGGLHPVLADAHRLPFPATAFDAAVLVHILHLVGAWPPVLVELGRVVRPGGVLALGLDEGQPGEAAWIGQRWAAIVGTSAAAPPEGKREAVTTAAVEWLKADGYRVEEEILARWTETQTPRDFLHRYRDRLFSDAWDLPDAVLQPALAHLTAELTARYADLDRPLPRPRWFRVMIAHRDHG